MPHIPSTPSPHSVRPELQEPAFRKFEQVFATAICGHPVPAQFNFRTAGLKQSTAISRLRDVVRSWIMFEWPGLWWANETDLKIIRPRARALKVYPHPEHADVILVGPITTPLLSASSQLAEEFGDRPVAASAVTISPLPKSHILDVSKQSDPDTTTQEVLTCFGYLLNLGVLLRDSKLELLNFPPDSLDFHKQQLSPIALRFGLLIEQEANNLFFS